MRILAVVLSMAGMAIGTACVDGTPIRAERARRVVRLVRTVETTMSVPLAQEYRRMACRKTLEGRRCRWTSLVIVTSGSCT